MKACSESKSLLELNLSGNAYENRISHLFVGYFNQSETISKLILDECNILMNSGITI